MIVYDSNHEPKPGCCLLHDHAAEIGRLTAALAAAEAREKQVRKALIDAHDAHHAECDGESCDFPAALRADREAFARVEEQRNRYADTLSLVEVARDDFEARAVAAEAKLAEVERVAENRHQSFAALEATTRGLLAQRDAALARVKVLEGALNAAADKLDSALVLAVASGWPKSEEAYREAAKVARSALKEGT